MPAKKTQTKPKAAPQKRKPPTKAAVAKLDRPAVLTYSQERFVEEYLRDLNALQAAQRSGVSLRQCYNYLAMPHVKEEIDARLAIRRQRNDMNEAYAMERLRMEIEYYGEGASHGARVNAIDKLFRRLGLYQDALTVQGNSDNPVVMRHEAGPVVIEAAKLSDEMKRKLLEYRVLGHVKGEVVDAPAE